MQAGNGYQAKCKANAAATNVGRSHSSSLFRFFTSYGSEYFVDSCRMFLSSTTNTMENIHMEEKKSFNITFSSSIVYSLSGTSMMAGRPIKL